MTQQLTLKPIVKDMLERAGVENVYDFAPSAKDCACPIVVANETYERTDMLDDCEYGKVTLEIIAVRETRDEVLSAIGSVIYALHQTDWERYSNDGLAIREMTIEDMPKEEQQDDSGRCRLKAEIAIEVKIGQ